MGYHALREQAAERLSDFQLADPRKGSRPEAGVEQVQDRMLDSADILLHRQPALDRFRIERTVIGLADKAQEVPGRVNKGVERIGLAPRCMAALRAIGVLPCRMAVERIARNVEGHVVGQHHRQVLQLSYLFLP